jgi:hypothetical protein
VTFFFNIEALEREAGDSYVKFMTIFEIIVLDKLPKSTYIKSVNRCKKGNSYLLNPKPLLNLAKNIDIAYIIQYIKLAARRDYTAYKYNNYAGLLLSYYPDINMAAIKHNPLLKITKQEILFKYEEIKKENK